MAAVNGHIESTYSTKTGEWTPPKFVQDPFLRLHGMAPGLNYGMQCYEGLKASRGPDDKTIGIFRPQANAERMQHSASYVSMPDVPVELFKKSVHLAVSLNAAYVPPHRIGASMYIRPLLIGSSAQLGLEPPEEYTFLVYVMPTGVYHGVHPVACLILEDFDRAAPEGTGNAKIGGNYAPVLRHSGKAKKEGYGITLHLDSRTRTEVDEFSTSGFIGIHGSPEQGCTIVVPDSKNVINSVTSNTICEIAKSWGWKVEQRPVSSCASFCHIGYTDNPADQVRGDWNFHRSCRSRNSSGTRTNQEHHYAFEERHIQVQRWRRRARSSSHQTPWTAER